MVQILPDVFLGRRRRPRIISRATERDIRPKVVCSYINARVPPQSFPSSLSRVTVDAINANTIPQPVVVTKCGCQISITFTSETSLFLSLGLINTMKITNDIAVQTTYLWFYNFYLHQQIWELNGENNNYRIFLLGTSGLFFKFVDF